MISVFPQLTKENNTISAELYYETIWENLQNDKLKGREVVPYLIIIVHQMICVFLQLKTETIKWMLNYFILLHIMKQLINAKLKEIPYPMTIRVQQTICTFLELTTENKMNAELFLYYDRIWENLQNDELKGKEVALIPYLMTIIVHQMFCAFLQLTAENDKMNVELFYEYIMTHYETTY